MPLTGERDSDLARLCRQGDARAWRRLVRRFTPLVYRLALRMLRNPATAEDVSQEVFMRMHRSFDGFDPTRPLAPWIGRITYNVCLRQLERAGRRQGETLTGDDLPEPEREPGSGGAPEERAATREASALLVQAVDELPAQDRALLALRYREGLSDAEVSEATGMPVGTVKTRIFQARARLRQRLSPVLQETE